MANAYSMDDLLEFLDHAGDRGLMPAATAQALAVASRNVLGVLSEDERKDLSEQELESVIRRFTNKRAKDFNPSSLKEYARRIRRAQELFLAWREDPANFTVKTRSTNGQRKREKPQDALENGNSQAGADAVSTLRAGTYQTSIPVRPGVVVTVLNLPADLTAAEAERIAGFVRMLAVES